MPVTYGDTVGVIVYMKKHTYEFVKRLAEDQGVSMSRMLRSIIESFVEVMQQGGVHDDRVQSGQEESSV